MVINNTKILPVLLEYKIAAWLLFAVFVFYLILVWLYFYGNSIDWGTIFRNYGTLIIIIVLATLLSAPLFYYFLVIRFNKKH